jgi:hypothetical protein
MPAAPWVGASQVVGGHRCHDCLALAPGLPGLGAPRRRLRSRRLGYLPDLMPFVRGILGRGGRPASSQRGRAKMMGHDLTMEVTTSIPTESPIECNVPSARSRRSGRTDSGVGRVCYSALACGVGATRRSPPDCSAEPRSSMLCSQGVTEASPKGTMKMCAHGRVRTRAYASFLSR